MSESTPEVATQPGDELLLELADDYLRRSRTGEQPTVDEYASKHPELADRIRELFPAMIAMEQPGPGATVDSAPPTERVGATIGRYKLLERIGEGGFGVVYMAEQQNPVRRKVALKVIKPGMDTRQVIARFEAERQALAIMDHPNIAKVFDAGATDSGRPYFVMELVKGEPITEFCDRSQLPPHDRLELFAQVCHAVQHAHQKGIIHRDIKPMNVLVAMHDTTPVVKVIDFGVAKALGQELTDKTLFTGFAQFLGTPLYMSPEQAGHSTLDIDTRSDIYSLGVLLYELLTGTTPFDKERFKKAAQDEIFRIIREEEPPKPSTRLSESKDSLPSISAQRQTEPAKLTKLVCGELDWIVMKALEKERTRRYETAIGMARDIERYLRDEPVEACPPSASYRFRKFAQRNKGALVTGLAIAAALVLGTLVSTWQAVRATRAERQVSRERDNAIAEKQQKEIALKEKQESLAKATRNERIAQEQLATGLIFAGQSQLKSKQAAQARQSFNKAWELSRALNLPETSPLCGMLMTYIASSPPLLGSDAPENDAGEFQGHVGAITTVELSQDGQNVLTGGRDRSVRWWDLRTGALVRNFSVDAPINAFKISPDGKTLFVGTTDGMLSAYDTGGQRLLQAPAHDETRAVAISPDGRWLLTAGGDALVKLWDAASLRELGTFRGHSASVHQIAFSPDLRRAYSSGENDHVGVWELPSGNLIAMFQAHVAFAIAALRVSPDGSILATASVDNTIRLWDAETLAPLRVLKGHSGTVKSIDFSFDGTRLVSGSFDHTVRLWDVKTGDEVAAFTGHQAAVFAVRFSPDGRVIVSGDADGKLKVWTPPSDSDVPTLVGHEDSVIHIALSHDGRLALTGGFDKTVRLWDVITGKTLRIFSEVAGRIRSVALSPDARFAVVGGDDSEPVLLDLATGGLIRRFHGHTDLISSVAYGPDGNTVISASADTTVRLWDVDTGKLLHTFEGHVGKVRYVAVSPDGAFALSAGSDGIAKLWSIPERKHVRDLVGHKHWVMCVAFSPDGSRALSGSWDRTVRMWDLQSGKALLTMSGHTSQVLGVTFSPDGRKAASASFDPSIQLWELGTGQPVAMLAGHSGPVSSVVCASEKFMLVSASQDRTIRAWNLDRPTEYQRFYKRLCAAQKALDHDRFDPEALKTFGQWYAFRGVYDWAAEFLEKASKHGADVSSLELARCYWQLDREADAAREFGKAIRRDEAPRPYLELCQSAVQKRLAVEQEPPR